MEIELFIWCCMYVSLVDFCYIVNEHSAKQSEDLISMVIPPYRSKRSRNQAEKFISTKIIYTNVA